ncbi:MAG: hypothetical protein A2039_02760 [Candidatus Melainabacteria bacterium GWA2_34_9]|nr:MAG: hypothetical protein A2039_02760 [Candidatus Melainabacteria bacterium GWA2_34_9]
MKNTSKGAIHIHTTYSDGTSTIKQIARAAKKAGLEWIIITDHNNLTGLKEEGWYDGVAVIVGEEISPPPGNHYLAFNITRAISEKLHPLEFINEVNKQGGFGFIAHPDESTNRKHHWSPLIWTDWEIKGFQGLEIWNYLSDWGDQFNPKRAFYDYLFKNHMLQGPTPKVLNWWDKLNNENKEIFPAIGSLDAHALKYNYRKIFILKIFPYKDCFKTITNYVYLEERLSPNFNEAKKQIYDAIKSGNNLIINRIWSKKSDDICFYIENGTKKAFSGDKIALHEETILTVKLPKRGNIKILHNGKVIRDVNTYEFQMSDLKTGKYRLEVRYKNRPWIFSNPIIVEG